MSAGATANHLLDTSVAAYTDALEYLNDELQLLDLRLRREMLSRRAKAQPDPLAPFKGLVITDTEVSDLLAETPTVETDSCGSREEIAEQRGLDELLQRHQTQLDERRAASAVAGVDLPLSRLARLIGLSRFEEECLIICLANDIDGKYAKLYAYLQDDATARKPSVDFVLRLLCESQTERLHARAAFDSSAPFIRYRLLQVHERPGENSGPLLSRQLHLDDRIADFLLGRQSMDARLERVSRITVFGQDSTNPSADDELSRRTTSFIRAHFGQEQGSRNVFFYLQGKSGQELRALVQAVCCELGLPLLTADVEIMRSGTLGFEESAWLLGREAALQSAVLCLEEADGLLAEADKRHVELKSLTDATATFSRLTFLLGSRSWNPGDLLRGQVFLPVTVPLPDFKLSRRLWQESLEACEHLAEDVSCDDFASKFRFGRSRIQAAISAAEHQALWRSPEDWHITAADLFAACRALSSPRLGTLAQKIDPKYAWDDIVLPADQLEQLKELCSQANHRHTVYGEWGFDRKLSLGKGLNALFSGPPGTGKTMAAEVIANALQLDLFRIDLSQVVSKYIGETEKNLHQIFLEAQAGHAILFFDEADALFGKRSEVKDAHDRYANIEIGYLLQKMEEYEGVAILATNLRQHIDDAFLRRMNFVVEFPFPDVEYRRRIWQVVFPEAAPLSDKVDFDLLAREIKLAGGNIKNIALRAAFYAAANGGTIATLHLWQAACREYQKLGRTWSSEELEKELGAEKAPCD